MAAKVLQTDEAECDQNSRGKLIRLVSETTFDHTAVAKWHSEGEAKPVTSERERSMFIAQIAAVGSSARSCLRTVCSHIVAGRRNGALAFLCP
eukprot:768697-Hanusia_phi.AAC.7